MNKSTIRICRQVQDYGVGLYWTPITSEFKSEKEMELAFNEMLRDDYTITENCTQTYFK